MIYMGNIDNCIKPSDNVEWFDKSRFEVFDHSEFAESDYHYSVKTGIYREDGKSPKDVYCDVSGYLDSNGKPHIYSDDDGRAVAYYDGTEFIMPEGLLAQVFETVEPYFEKTRAEFDRAEAEYEGK